MKAGICFEALEPRLLFSGSWGAVVDGTGPDTPSDSPGGFTRASMVLHTDTVIDTAGSENRHLKTGGGRVDFLSLAPALNTLGNPVLSLDASSASMPAAPVNDTATTTPVADRDDAATHTEERPDTVEAVARRELVLVNDDVAAYDMLINGIRESDADRVVEIVVLDADRDGIQQVSDILAERSDLAAVHVIAHGSDGQINLGSSCLNSTTLQQNRDVVAGWGSALTESGDFLFYGCNVAADGDGQILLDDITRLTGADVAASVDATGYADKGGDWDIEYRQGEIETSVVVGAEMQDNWFSVLATVTNVGTVADKSAAHTTTEITVGASGVSSGNTLIITIALNFSNGEDLNIPTATDSQGNTYNTDIDVFPDGTAARLAIISANITTPLTNGDTITVTHAPSAASTMSVQEVSGLLSSGALDQTASSSGASLSASSGSTTTTSQANELVFGAILVKGPVTETFTEESTYTLIGRDGTEGAAASSNRTINPVYKIVSSTDTYSADGTLGTTSTWIAAVATYKLAPANAAPVITSDGGGDTAITTVEENSTAVTTVTATDADGDTPTYSISGGADATLFSIDANTGVLTFNSAPNFEAPADADSNNVYQVTVQASDGNGGIDTQAISVTVTDALELVVTNTNATGTGSLYEAILNANANTGVADTITFNIGGVGPHSINVPAGGLPTITDTLIIDGWSQPDYAGSPVIELNGAGAGVGVHGLNLTGGAGSVIRGLVINRFGGDAININADNVTVVGCYLGTDVTGTVDLGNTDDGIDVDANNVIIGGTTTANRNIISGNNGDGINLGSGYTGAIIRGNYIGTDATGTLDLGNSVNGILVEGPNNTIGGTTAGASNVIAGNDAAGIYLSGSGANTVQGNYIGTDTSGTSIIANSGQGIYVDTTSVNNLIGGNVCSAQTTPSRATALVQTSAES